MGLVRALKTGFGLGREALPTGYRCPVLASTTMTMTMTMTMTRLLNPRHHRQTQFPTGGPGFLVQHIFFAAKPKTSQSRIIGGGTNTAKPRTTPILAQAAVSLLGPPCHDSHEKRPVFGGQINAAQNMGQVF